MDWVKKHSDSAIILIAILASAIFVSEKLNELKKDMELIKTVIKNIRPIKLTEKQAKETNE